MPQGPAELHEKWEDDAKALAYLESRGFGISRGGIICPAGMHQELTDEDESAIAYLVLEWDYGWSPEYQNKHEYVASRRNKNAEG